MHDVRTSVNLSKGQQKIVFGILLLQGIGILLPWNMFITARSYFADYKLSTEETREDTPYATYFLNFVGFASQIPNLLFNWINVFINFTGSVTPRIATSITIELLAYLITTILTVVDTRSCVSLFFWITMITVVVVNMAGGIYQNTIYGIAAVLPPKFSGALILGCNLSGVTVALAHLLTQVMTTSVQTSALSYFITSFLVLSMCLVSYFAPQGLVNIFLSFYYNKNLLLYSVGTSRDEENRESDRTEKIPYWRIFKIASLQLINVFLVFFVTLCIFPGMLAGIKKSDPNFFISVKYYEIIMCFLTFNVTAVLGTVLSNLTNWPGPKALLIAILLRGLLIPFFFFCNYQPNPTIRKVPVIIRSDWLYWFGCIILGFTSGFLGTKAMIQTTRAAGSVYESICGKIGSAVLVTAIFFGVTASALFPYFAGL